MLQKVKVSAVQLFNDPNTVRTILVLSVLALAAIAGAAPHDAS